MRDSESDEFKLWVPRYPMTASGGGGAFKASMLESDEFKLWVPRNPMAAGGGGVLTQNKTVGK